MAHIASYINQFSLDLTQLDKLNMISNIDS